MFVVAAAAAFVAVLSLAAFFGSAWWVLDLVAAFRPQLVVGLTGAGVALAIGRWPRLAVLVLLVAVVNAVPIVPLFAGSQRGAERELRVLSFNVLAKNENYAEVVEFIRRSEADVVVLHEASEPWEDAVAAADLDYTIYKNRPSEDIFGSMVLAPADAVVESFGFRASDPRAASIELASGVSLLAIHPLSPATPRRARLRDQQLAWAGDWVLAQQGPVIVVGDFNATPYSYPYRRLVKRTGLRDSVRGFGLELSFPARRSPLLQVSIDHLLYSADLTIVDRRLGPALGSDHNPLTVDLDLDRD